MKVLVLGGTGAIGTPLVKKLSSMDYKVIVTSRSERKPENDRVSYIKGDAHDVNFINNLCENNQYDAIIDFMVYTTKEFANRINLFLSSTRQYVYISSARVYAESNVCMTEESPRLLDVCKDLDYLKTEEYGLTKARQENLLIQSGKKNWTIVRPSLTYNSNRLQLATYEKEEWLYRAILGRSIVFPRDLTDIVTTMSFGDDVAMAIALLVNNSRAIGEIFHIAGSECVTWKNVLDIYINVLENRLKKKIFVYYIDNAEDFCRDFNRSYQLKYARGIDRKFSNKKLINAIGDIQFTLAEHGLANCLNQWLDENIELRINTAVEAYLDRISGETIKPNELSSIKSFAKYLLLRYTPYMQVWITKNHKFIGKD